MIYIIQRVIGGALIVSSSCYVFFFCYISNYVFKITMFVVLAFFLVEFALLFK